MDQKGLKLTLERDVLNR